MRMLLILMGLILLVFPTLLTLGEFTNRFWYQYSVSTVKDYLATFMMIGGFAPMFGLGMGLAVGQFGYLHKRQKLDYFHALPVRREEHFIGRALAAVVSLAGAAVLLAVGQSFAVFVTLGLDGGISGALELYKVYSYIWGTAFLYALPALGAYLFTALIIILTATLWETIFSLLAVSAVYPVIVLFTYSLVQCSIPVNSFEVDAGSATLLSPLAYGFYMCAEWVGLALPLQYVPLVLVEILHIAVCGVLAFVFFCRRKSELAETGGATRFKLVVRFAAAVCAVMLGSLALLWITDNYFAYIAGSVLGLVGAWLVMELLYTRSVRKAMKCIVPNVIGYSLFVVINVLVAFGVIGVPHIPNLEDINAVAVNYTRETYEDDYSETDSFHGNVEWVYTDAEEERNVSMGSFDAALVRDGRALAEEILKAQDALYFPYLPRQWGGPYSTREYGESNEYEYISVTVKLYTENDVLQLSCGNYSPLGSIDKLYEQAKAIAMAEDYQQSNPSLPIMERLDYVMYTNYEEKNVSEKQYSLSNIADPEDFIERLQAAYLADMYSPNVEEYVYEEYTYDASTNELVENTTEEVPVTASAVPISVTDEYVLYFDLTQSITLQGGIIDSFYPAEGLECWLRPEFTPDYVGEALNSEEIAQSGSTMYFYRSDFPKTCAVLDELRMAAAE